MDSGARIRPQEPGRRSIGAVLRAAAAVALVSSIAIGVGLAFVIARLNEWPLDLDAPLLAGHLTLLYLIPNAVAVGGASALFLMLGFRPGARVFTALVVSGFLLLNGLQRFISSVQLLSVTPHMSAIGVIDLFGVAAAASAVGLGIANRRVTHIVGCLATACALLLALTLLHHWHEKPLERDLAQAVPPALAAPSGRAPAPPAAGERFSGARLVLLGFDGLSWEVLLPLLRRGELPNFRAMLAESAYGYLESLSLPFSPVIWETISTGRAPRFHGIGYHAHFSFPGVTRKVRFLPSYSLGHTAMRVRSLLSHASRFGCVTQLPAESSDAQVARFWEIVSRSGRSVGVYNWLNTSPVAAIHGFMHGYGPVRPRVFPEDLEVGISPLPAEPGAVSVGVDSLQETERYERTNFERFRQLALRFHPEVLLFYTHFGDAVNHINWKQETWGDGLLLSGLTHPDIEPGPAITEVMRFLDDVLGEVRARLPEDALLAIVSDHGFDFRGYEHDNSPPGVILLHGPGVRPGLVRGASVYDVTPTLLAWLDLPVAEDMAGAPLEAAAPAHGRALSRIASYGSAERPLSPGTTAEDALRRHEEHLRSLGYVN